MLLVSHIIAFIIGYVLDLIFGSLEGIPSPVDVITELVSKQDHKYMDSRMSSHRDRYQERRDGIATCAIVIGSTVVSVLLVIILTYVIHFILGIIAESILTYYLISARKLRDSSMKVHDNLKSGYIKEARGAVAKIDGRDVDNLDHEAVSKVIVENISKNTVDDIVAPLFYTAVGGPVLGYAYLAISILDTMLGHHNERYESFGKPAARLDDWAKFVPARLGAWLMITASFIGSNDFLGNNAIKIYKRDRFKTKSPSAGYTISVCAGALGIKLGGDVSYAGEVEKNPYIGNEIRKTIPLDIKKTCGLMFLTELLCVLICLSVLVIIYTILH